jgi:hypothetical protein
MPTNRFQFSDDFTLNNGNVGINSATPQTKLDVDGVIKGESLKVTGVSSFTTYEGFLNSNQNIVENTTISGGGRSGSLSGEIIVGTGITVTVASDTTSSQGSVDSLKVYNTFTVPVGGTADRPVKVKPGQLFFNRDFATMEFWDGDRWRQVDNTTRSGKMLFGPGFTPSGTSTAIDTINAHSLGNATDFGILSSSRATYGGGGGNSTRGLFGGGYFYSNVIDYVTIQSAGNAIDFGDLSRPNFGTNTSCSSTRCVWWLGTTNTPAVANTNIIEYVQISTLGNSLDFGDTTGTKNISAGFGSPVRGICAGTIVSPSSEIRSIEFISIASLGNASDFGDTDIDGQGFGSSNTTRGIFGGTSIPSGGSFLHTITISSLGNSFNFGDLTVFREGCGSASTQTRCINAGGNNSSGTYNTIDYVTISTLGNAQDFGDLTTVKRNIAGVSDSHGGLGGF